MLKATLQDRYYGNGVDLHRKSYCFSSHAAFQKEIIGNCGFASPAEACISKKIGVSNSKLLEESGSKIGCGKCLSEHVG